MPTTNGDLAVRRIVLTNIGGIRGELEIPLGQITYLEGGNGVGKSSAINGLAALCGAPVADLLTQGEEEGEAYLELTDNTFFRRRITADGKNVLTAGHPDQGSIGKAAAWLKATLSVAALSPAEFLGADDVKAAEYILRTTPLKVSKEELVAAAGDGIELNGVDVKGHALTVLDRAIKALYDERTGENRVAKESRATAEQLRKSIPENAEEPEAVGERVAWLRATLAGILEEREAAEQAAAQAARAAADEELEDAERAVEQHGADVVRLKAELRTAEDALRLARDRRDEVTAQRDARVEEAEKAAGAPFAERQATASAELASAQQAHEAAKKAATAIQNTRTMIADQEGKAEAAHIRSRALTDAMGRLEALKASKAAELPIEGVSIVDGKLRIGGVPANRANTAERIRVALDASTAQKARIPFVFADDLEHLSTKTRTQVEQACRDRGIQVLGARVTDDEELTVRTAGGVTASFTKQQFAATRDPEDVAAEARDAASEVSSTTEDERDGDGDWPELEF